MRKLRFLCTLASLLIVSGLYAQVKVSGKVTDAGTGAGLPGVSVKVKGGDQGTSTGDDGSFSLDVPANAKVLEFSYVGYASAEQAIGKSFMAVKMNLEARNLEEIVVTGYGSQIKRELTGNIARVKGKEIENMPTPSVDQALQGKAAGVYVNSQSGKLGQAVTVRVRGNSSISASSQPLFVVDGIPITTQDQSSYGGDMNPLVDLNPNDIESIEILKDASAGAIYGSRAANGVVLITTKRGKAGRTQVSANFQGGFSEATRRVRFLNAEEYATMFLQATGWYDNRFGIDPNDPSSETSWAKDWMNYNSFGQWATNPKASYDWQDQAFQRGGYKQADLQITGGNDKTKFFASAQHLDQVGTIIGNNLNRTSGRLTVDHKAYDWLTVGLSMNLARTYNRRLPDDNAFSNPLQSVALMPVTPFTDPNTGLPTGTPPGDVNLPLYYNPRITVDYGKFGQEVFRNFTNAYLTAKLVHGLTFTSEFGMDLLSQNEESYFQNQTVRNQTRATNGLGQNYSAFVANYNTNNYFSYRNEFGKHSVDATLGMGYQESTSKYSFTEGLDFPSNSYQKIASAATKSGGSS
ncbi:MAG TPA: SusC/RagA family TonB-linked outer membrane protein, partial [Phnomibacter sp.]|nr:SusC/RagA family TonB-linked outer membrane protein [Phnomibacter sp.]